MPVRLLVLLVSVSGCSLFGSDDYVYPETEVGRFAFDVEEAMRGEEGGFKLVRYSGTTEAEPSPRSSEWIDLYLRAEPREPSGAAPRLRLSISREVWEQIEPNSDAGTAAYYESPQYHSGGGRLAVAERSPIFRARFDVDVEREVLFGVATVGPRIRGSFAVQHQRLDPAP